MKIKILGMSLLLLATMATSCVSNKKYSQLQEKYNEM